jgi:hypothetical protein
MYARVCAYVYVYVCVCIWLCDRAFMDNVTDKLLVVGRDEGKVRLFDGTYSEVHTHTHTQLIVTACMPFSCLCT